MKNKNGWLVVNGFMKSDKFSDIYDLLLAAAERASLRLEMVENDRLCPLPDRLPDIAVFWDKDLPLVRSLERAGVRCFNSARTIELCDDKIKTAEACAGLPAPRTVIAPFTYDNTGYTDTGFLDRIGKELGFPLVIKPAVGSFGRGVFLAQNAEEAAEHIKKLRTPFLCQQYVPHTFDLRINVVGGRAVSAIRRTNGNDFRSNVTLGGRAEACAPSKKEEELAVAAAAAVGADFAGVDIFGGDKPLLVEVNSNPHFRSTLDCTGLNMADEIMKYIGGSV